MDRRLLVTGGAGFIAGNLVHHWVKTYPKDKIVVIDSLTYASNIQTIKSLIDNKTIDFFKGDINDSKLLEKLFDEYNINHVAHLAAESHVDRSISGPEVFLKSNVHGTYKLLESFYNHWKRNKYPKDFRFLHVSTDEVFGSLSENDIPFNENTSYDPRSPYSATKAASDHLANAWFHTYDLPVLISNCSNNYGPYHYPEKLIPLTFTKIIKGETIPVYGDGKNIRDWLYVEDHCAALECILLKGKPGRSYCIGGNNELKNIDLVHTLCSLMDELSPEYNYKLPVIPSHELIKFVKDRPGHDERYAIDPSRVMKELNWRPTVDIMTGLRKTLEWYLQNRSWWEPLIKD